MPDLRFDTIFDHLPGRYLILDPSLVIVAVNDAYLEATMTTRPQLLGRFIFDAFPENPDQPAGGVSKLRESLEFVLKERQAHTMGVTKYDIPRHGGGFEERYWSPVNAPILGEDGAVALIIHRVEDLTAYVQLRERGQEMEQELFERGQELQALNRQLRGKNAALEQRDEERERLLARLREADRIKTTFFANVSHEFRTPLTLLLGILTDDAALTGERRAVLVRNARRLLRLVDDLLDIARIEAGRMDVTFVPADVADLTRRAAAAFEPLLQRAGLGYEIAVDALPEPVYVDVDSYEKILLNLLSNAFKFTTRGTVTVRLRQRGRTVQLQVEDTGVGIPPEEIPRVFERFHRAHAIGGRSIEGSGIGLALTSELVQLHGGSITATSVPGRGSTFTVELPLGFAHLPADQVRHEPLARDARDLWDLHIAEAAGWIDGGPRARPASSGRSPNPPARLLVADDNADMRGYIADILAPLGEILLVADGAAALEAAIHHHPDLVIADVMMPGKSGLELIDALHAHDQTAQIPVLLLSAHASEGVRVQGLRAGAEDYIVKPFSRPELVERVEAILARARQQQHLADESRRKDEFLAMLAHELRNPLAPLRSGIDLLAQDAVLSPGSGRALAIMDRQVTALARILDDLLDVSRISQRKVVLKPQRVDLRTVASGAVEAVRPDARARRHELVVSIPDDAAWAEVDPVRMEQVLVNLLANAIKYTPPGGRISLALERRGDELHVRVRDTGAGLEPDELSSIFGLFTQVRARPEHSDGGLGIGLTIAQQLVDMHGGQLTAASEGRDRGSEFLVRLPAAAPESPTAEAAPAAVTDDRDALRLRILVVDDNVDAANLLAESLGLLGNDTRSAHSANAALTELSTWHPDVAILDIGLPDLDGYQLAAEIRQRTSPPPRLIALTGYGQPDDRQRSRAAGFDAHLVKPVALDTLLSLLQPVPGTRPPEGAT